MEEPATSAPWKNLQRWFSKLLTVLREKKRPKYVAYLMKDSNALPVHQDIAKVKYECQFNQRHYIIVYVKEFLDKEGNDVVPYNEDARLYSRLNEMGLERVEMKGDDTVVPTTKKVWRDYRKRMSKLYEWGNPHCIQAVADIFCIKVILIDSHKKLMMTDFYPRGTDAYYGPIYLCRTSCHMDCMRRVSQPQAPGILNMLRSKRWFKKGEKC